MNAPRTNSKKMLYTALYNSAHPETALKCLCIPPKIDKRYIGSDSVTSRLSNNMRISQIVNTRMGGSIQYGNFYLGQPLQLDYLGNVEGMPGGVQVPPRNAFS